MEEPEWDEQVTVERWPSTSIASYPDYEVIFCQGEVDAHSFEAFENQVESLMDDDSSYVLNLGGLEYINSAGIGLIISMNSKLDDLILTKIRPYVLETLEMLGFVDLFELDQTLKIFETRLKQLETTFTSRTRELKGVREKITELLSPYQEGKDEVYQLISAIDEVLSNLLEHSVNFDESQPIKLGLDVFNNGVRILVEHDFDTNKSFNPDREKKNLQEFQQDESRRGLGLYIIDGLIDRVEYDFSSELNNCIRMEKFFEVESLGFDYETK